MLDLGWGLNQLGENNVPEKGWDGGWGCFRNFG